MINNRMNFAYELINSWNSHNLERIMKHYSDDCELASPYINKLLGNTRSILKGKETIRDFWKIALSKVPDLHLELIDIAECVETLAIYYKHLNGKRAIEIMFFNKEGKINKVFVHYNVQSG